MNKDFVRAIIKNNLNEYLVVIDSNCNFPGGKVEKNESKENALIREVLEETGLHVKSMTLISNESIVLNEVSWDGSFYLVDDYVGEPINNEPHKFSYVGFKSKSWILKNKNFIFIDIFKKLEDIELKNKRLKNRI